MIIPRPRQCPLLNLVYLDLLPASDQPCTATLVMLSKICTRTAKRAPYPPCTVTAFWLKYQDRARMLRRVTQPPHIAGPLAGIKSNISRQLQFPDKTLHETNFSYQMTFLMI